MPTQLCLIFVGSQPLKDIFSVSRQIVSNCEIIALLADPLTVALCEQISLYIELQQWGSPVDKDDIIRLKSSGKHKKHTFKFHKWVLSVGLEGFDF